MTHWKTARTLALAAVLAIGVAACDNGVDVNARAHLSVLLTDAAADYIDGAMVDIGAIELVGGGGPPVVLTEDGTDGMVNLLEFQDEVTLALADLDIPAGTYSQLRLIVEDASVSLLAPHEFNGGGSTMALGVPSGAQTGIKLNLTAATDDGDGGGVEISGDMVLVVDFDVNESFVIQGNPETPAGIESVSFKPTLRVAIYDVAGTISGDVTTSVEGLAVEGMMVSATPVDGTTLEPFQAEVASAMVDDTGHYTIYFVVPGEYTVEVDAGEGFTTNPASGSATVGESQDVEDVDFEVIASG